jgi:Protein of unknown function (DUF1186)
MDILDILRQMERNDGYFARAAVTEALARRDEIVPELLRILEAVADDPQRYAKEPYPDLGELDSDERFAVPWHDYRPTKRHASTRRGIAKPYCGTSAGCRNTASTACWCSAS